MPDIFVAKEKQESRVLAKEKTEESRLLAAFVRYPRNLHFETQEKKEKIILLLRRHPITNLPWIFLALLILITPLIVLPFVSIDFFPAEVRFISLLCWYLFSFAFIFERFLIWFFNVYILTDERVIDIDFPTLLYRQIAETKIDRIQNVSTKTGGYLRSLFSFGDVLIQSAEALPQIVFEAVPNPERVAVLINNLILEEEQEKIEGRIR